MKVRELLLGLVVGSALFGIAMLAGHFLGYVDGRVIIYIGVVVLLGIGYMEATRK